MTRAVLLDPKPLLADATGDMRVDFRDFQILEVNFGSEIPGLNPAAARGRGDFNGDGAIDSLDFVILKEEFGWWIPAVPGGGGAGASVVPEPGAALIAGAVLALARRRIRR